MSDRHENVLVRVRYFDRLRRIVGLFNENGECSKRLSNKAAGLLARGAYTEYVSTPKARERSWRPFSTLPRKGSEDLAKSNISAVDLSNLGPAPKTRFRDSLFLRRTITLLYRQACNQGCLAGRELKNNIFSFRW